jgi:hypothetical protein
MTNKTNDKGSVIYAEPLKRTLLNKSQQEITLNFYEVLAVPAVLYGRECRTEPYSGSNKLIPLK